MTTMKNSDNIKLLTEKFFDGITTLEEEKTLYSYFSGDDIEQSLIPLQDMFRDLAALNSSVTADSIPTSVPATAKRPKAKWRNMWTAFAAAAAAILLLVIVKTQTGRHEEQQLAALYEGSYMIVDGKRIDDLREIKNEIEKNLSEAEQIERLMTADDMARKAELDVLSVMQTEEEREKIEKLINDDDSDNEKR